MNRYREYLRSDAVYHILIWALLIIPHGFFSYPLLERFGATKYIANLLVTDVLLLVVVYLNVFYLIRKYYKARKFVTYYAPRTVENYITQGLKHLRGVFKR